ncbi:hypothetical protein TDB9533_01805 [Thalassocella blandensis]|nr:hypothetical protein TDB9533_01805 [Thalassocella blandensis]
MSRQKPLLIIALLFYIVAPSLFEWMSAISGSWYRPFIIWLAIIIIAYIVQFRDKSHDV